MDIVKSLITFLKSLLPSKFTHKLKIRTYLQQLAKH